MQEIKLKDSRLQVEINAFPNFNYMPKDELDLLIFTISQQASIYFKKKRHSLLKNTKD